MRLSYQEHGIHATCFNVYNSKDTENMYDVGAYLKLSLFLDLIIELYC